MCISISATVALGCLFSPKVYLVLFQPYKNVRPGASIGGGGGAGGGAGGGNSSNNNHNQQKFSQTSKFRNKGKQKSSLYMESSGGCATTGPPSSSGGAPAASVSSMDSLAQQQQQQQLAITQYPAQSQPSKQRPEGDAGDMENREPSSSSDGVPMSPLSLQMNGESGIARAEELSVCSGAGGDSEK